MGIRCLITGGAGFIGSHLVDALLDAGARVRVLDDLSTGRLANLPGQHQRLEFIRGDIGDGAFVERCAEAVDCIVHLAAVASVQSSVEQPVRTHQTNFDGTLNVLEAARSAGVRRVIYASSAAVYGDCAAVPVAEDAVLSPLTPYAADKLAGEHYLRFYALRYGISATAFRFFNIYGPRQDPSSPYSGVISIFTDRARANLPITVFGDGEQTRDFVYVGDLVKILAAAVGRNPPGFQIVNVGGGRQVSLLDLLNTIEALLGRPIMREHAESRPGDILHSCADVRRLSELYGLVPSAPLSEGLGRLLEG